MAADRGCVDVVHLLLHQQGIKVNSQDQNGHTPLHLAAYWNYSDVVSKLLEIGLADVNITNNKGHTPFDLAKYKKNERSANILDLLRKYIRFLLVAKST